MTVKKYFFNQVLPINTILKCKNSQLCQFKATVGITGDAVNLCVLTLWL